MDVGAATFEALQETKQKAAAPLYAAVQNQVVPITPTLESLMERPAFREAFEQAVTTEANFGRQMPLIEDLLKTGPVTGVKVKFWDTVKKGLDDVIAAKKRGLSVDVPSNKNRAQSTLASSLDIKNELVTEIDRLTGNAYKAARDAYAGPRHAERVAGRAQRVDDGDRRHPLNAAEGVTVGEGGFPYRRGRDDPRFGWQP